MSARCNDADASDNIAHMSATRDEDLSVPCAEERDACARSYLRKGRGIMQLDSSQRQMHLETAIGCFKAALSVWSATEAPEEWGESLLLLGLAFESRSEGTRSANLEQAIGCYRKLFDLWNRADYPLRWASLNTKLAGALSSQETGDVVRTSEEATKCYRNALHVWNREEYPMEWASLQMDLGNALRSQVGGNRGQNVQDAISCYKSALEEWTEVKNPRGWAALNINLGNALRDQLVSDGGASIDEAIDCYQKALKYRTETADPEEWAVVQTNLGNAFRNRITHRKKDNLEDSIRCHKNALRVWKQNKHPQLWATAQTSLGNALGDRIAESREQNLEDAIKCFEEALKVWKEDNAPFLWASTQMNLGTTLGVRIAGRRNENIDKAIHCFKNALTKRKREKDPFRWAFVQMNLALALSDRINGDKGQNLEDSIAHFQRALKVWKQNSAPQQWATAQMNLGNALSSRIAGNRAENLEDARQCFLEALKEWTRVKAPWDWASTQMNLGIVLVDRIAGDKEQNLEDAIACFKEALKEHTRDADPLSWAKVKMHLGLALQARIRGDSQQNLDEAISCFRNSLKERRRDVSERSWAMVQLNLGNALRVRTNGLRTNDLEEAASCAENALEVFRRETDPLSYLLGCRLHARILVVLRSPEQAIAAVQRALGALDYAQSLSSAGLLHARSLAEHSGHLSGDMFALYLNLKDNAKALKACDDGKASLLRSMISEGVDISSQLSDGEREDFERAKNEVRRLKHELDEAAGRGERFNALLGEYESATQVVGNIVTSVRKANDDHLQATSAPISSREMVDFASRNNALLLVFFFAPEYSKMRTGDFSESLHAFTVWNGTINVRVAAPDLSDPGKGELMPTFTRKKIKEEPKATRELRQKIEAGYLKRIGSFLSQVLSALPTGREPRKAMIVPHRGLHKVPFSAIPLDASFCCAPHGDRTMLLGDLLAEGLWTMPSISVAMQVSCKKTEHKGMRQSQIVSVTCPSTSRQLGDVIRHQQQEGAIAPIHITDQYPARDKIKQDPLVSSCDVLHLSCHGKFAGRGDMVTAHLNPSEVLKSSGLMFKGNAPPRPAKSDTLLSMVDIWGMNLRCWLACVVACSGAVVDTLSQNDESLSIGTAFLVAGARHVVCTLWPVDQVVAVVLMSRFFENLCGAGEGGRASMATCLAEAQRWFRRLSDTEYHEALRREGILNVRRPDNRNLYHWAAFCIVGPPEDVGLGTHTVLGEGATRSDNSAAP